MICALAACGHVKESDDASPPGDDAAPTVDAACTPTGADAPDDMFLDQNCDGIDGDASTAVFVDPLNGNDAGDGLQAQPKAHLLGSGGAFAKALADGKSNIFISTGTLSESATVVVPSGLSLWGGYDAAQGWARSDAIAHPLLMVADPTGVSFQTIVAAMTWDRVDVQSANATAPGASSYGMFVASSTDALVISNSSVTAGDGAPGSASQAPAAPTTPLSANGLVGSGAYTAVCCQSIISDTCMAGQPGQNACAFSGGQGSPCGNGGSPAAGGGPSGGAPGGLREQGKPGGAGTAGADATAPTAAFGASALAGYTPAQGTVGGAGAGGSGGGGGGLDYVGSCTCGSTISIPAGHGGAAGGCGGGPASAAGGGGGSFAIYLFDSGPTLDRVTLISGNGGKGGAGTRGGNGGPGGVGGGQPTATVAGGNGGAGGVGGTSSGGPGGPSICLEKAGSSAPTLVTTPTCQLGAAGNGGSSPSSNLTGVTGLKAEQHP